MKALLLLLDSSVFMHSVKDSDLVASSNCLWFWCVASCHLCPTLTLLVFCLFVNATHWYCEVCNRSRPSMLPDSGQSFLSRAQRQYPPGWLPFRKEKYYHRITEWFGLEGTLKIQPCFHGQGHIPLDHVCTIFISGAKNLNQTWKRGYLQERYLCGCCMSFYLSLMYA